jgi:membrane associated rhomboid family serine protease
MFKDTVHSFFVKWFGPSRSAVQQIIATCVLVFLLSWLIILITLYPTSNRTISHVILDWLKFSPIELSQGYKFLSPFTYMFLHINAWHLLGNMLWLYFVGVILEDLVGRQHIWKLFIWGGLFGAFFIQLFYSALVFFDVPGAAYFPENTLGASAGVSAVVLATAIFTPRYRLFLFGLIEIEIRWIVLVKVLLDVMGIFGNNNVGGYAAHLGGLLWGTLYAYGVLKGDFLQPTMAKFTNLGNWITSSVTPKERNISNMRVNRTHNDVVSKNRKSGQPSEETVNQILDKISQVGYNNLSQKEKETLFKASQDQ